MPVLRRPVEPAAKKRRNGCMLREAAANPISARAPDFPTVTCCHERSELRPLHFDEAAQRKWLCLAIAWNTEGRPRVYD
jgi:hypothetical protein